MWWARAAQPPCYAPPSSERRPLARRTYVRELAGRIRSVRDVLGAEMGRLLRWVLLMVVGGLCVGVSAAAAAPAPPALVGSVSNTGSLSGATAVAVSGQYAYTTAYWGGVLTAVDISDPASLSVAGSSTPATSLYNGSTVNVAGGYAFVASKNRNASASSNDDGTGNSLTILNIQGSNAAAPAVVGTLHDPTNLFGAYGVAVSGNDAYVASQGLLGNQPTAPDTSTGSFSVIDLSNGVGAPTIVGHIDNGSLPSPWTGTNALEHVTSVAISGNYAYVTAFDSDRLTVIDISNPASPTIVASLHDSVNLVFPADVAVSGNYAYVANQTGTSKTNLAAVNISNPANPTVVGSVAPASELSGAYRVRVSGNFAYVSASSTATVAAIDISDPTSPRVAGYVTSATNLNTTTGLDFDPNGGYIIASSPRLASESNPKVPPYPATTGTISSIQLDPVPIAVTIRFVLRAVAEHDVDGCELRIRSERSGLDHASVPARWRAVRGLHEFDHPALQLPRCWEPHLHR